VKRQAVLAGLAQALAATLQAQPVLDVGIFSDVLVAQPARTGPTDLRFFGTFCLPAPREFCKSIPVLPDPCRTLSSLQVHLDHRTTQHGALLSGGGPLVIDGKQGFLGLAGSVVRRGRMRFIGQVPGVGEQLGEATLSEDGMELTATSQNRSVSVRKDACGNNAPQVELVAPFGPTFPFGRSIMLSGTITDEDSAFPTERIVFTSDRQGLIPGTRIAGGRTLFTTALVTGNHRVTVTVTDSGGLAGQDSLDITVVNRPPDVPKIIQPAASASLPTGAPILLRGTAFDPDSGLLPPSALAWTAQLAPGGPFVALGTGNELTTTFAAAADPVLIRLTATDNASQQAHVERQVKVVPGTGNAPPNVAIRQPDPMLQPGPWVGGATVGFVAHYVGDAWDVEDPPGDLQLRWEFVALEGMGGAVDPTPPSPNPPPVTGTLAPDVTFPVGDKFYRVIFTATDSGGLSNSESIEVYVTAGVIL
jgi:hypothetical protein